MGRWKLFLLTFDFAKMWSKIDKYFCSNLKSIITQFPNYSQYSSKSELNPRKFRTWEDIAIGGLSMLVGNIVKKKTSKYWKFSGAIYIGLFVYWPLSLTPQSIYFVYQRKILYLASERN